MGVVKDGEKIANVSGTRLGIGEQARPPHQPHTADVRTWSN